MVTIRHIKDGKHLCGALEAHFILYLALDIDENQLIEKDLKEVVVNALTETDDYKTSVKEAIITTHETILEAIRSLELTNLQQIFDASDSSQLRLY